MDGFEREKWLREIEIVCIHTNIDLLWSKSGKGAKKNPYKSTNSQTSSHIHANTFYVHKQDGEKEIKRNKRKRGVKIKTTKEWKKNSNSSQQQEIGKHIPDSNLNNYSSSIQFQLNIIRDYGEWKSERYLKRKI